MIVNLKNNWTIDIDDSCGLRHLSNEKETIILDSNNEVMINIEVNDKGNIKLRSIAYNCNFEVGEKVVYISGECDNGFMPEVTNSSSMYMANYESIEGMTPHEKVIAWVSESPNPTCDDCLSSVLGIHPRDYVTKICNELSANNEIKREEGKCIFCENIKYLNSKF